MDQSCEQNHKNTKALYHSHFLYYPVFLSHFRLNINHVSWSYKDQIDLIYIISYFHQTLIHHLALPQTTHNTTKICFSLRKTMD